MVNQNRNREATGGRPPSRLALRRTTFDDARETRPASRSRERSERLAKVGWEAGIRNQRKQVLQLTDGARVVVTTRSVLATSGHHSSLQESPRILANLPDSWRHCGDVMCAIHARCTQGVPAAKAVMVILCSSASRLSLRSTPLSRGCGLDPVCAQGSLAITWPLAQTRYEGHPALQRGFAVR